MFSDLKNFAEQVVAADTRPARLEFLARCDPAVIAEALRQREELFDAIEKLLIGRSQLTGEDSIRLKAAFNKAKGQ
jgi:hypothetical protein